MYAFFIQHILYKIINIVPRTRAPIRNIINSFVFGFLILKFKINKIDVINITIVYKILKLSVVNNNVNK